MAAELTNGVVETGAGCKLVRLAMAVRFEAEAPVFIFEIWFGGDWCYGVSGLIVCAASNERLTSGCRADEWRCGDWSWMQTSAIGDGCSLVYELSSLLS